MGELALQPGIDFPLDLVLMWWVDQIIYCELAPLLLNANSVYITVWVCQPFPYYITWDISLISVSTQDSILLHHSCCITCGRWQHHETRSPSYNFHFSRSRDQVWFISYSNIDRILFGLKDTPWLYFDLSKRLYIVPETLSWIVLVDKRELGCRRYP